MSAVSNLHGARGPLVHAPLLGQIEYQADAVITFDDEGNIKHVIDCRTEEGEQLASCLEREGRLFTSEIDQVLIPGLIDLHVHAPQFPQLGKCLDVPLEDWLMNYTFPLEARYVDHSFAEHVYDHLVRELISHGTTTAVYFATIHSEASLALARRCLTHGQRAVVGKLSMDNPLECPPFYREDSASASVAGTREFIEAVAGLDGNGAGLVKSAVTPRFLPSCTDELMAGLSKLAAEHNCHVQTHCSESDWEHNYGLKRFGTTDTFTLDRFGLLTDRTILAHCNFISDDDIERIKSVGAGIAHCPLSNVYFSHAVLACRHALEAGVDVGLGSDIAGGPSPSLVANMQMAIHVSRMLEDGVDHRVAKEARGRAGSRISSLEAFWMATTAGGRALGEPIGMFRQGYRFDAVLMNVRRTPFQGLGLTTIDRGQEIIDQLVYTSDRQDLRKVWIDGRRVLDKDAVKN
jgi:guanine deaminase